MHNQTELSKKNSKLSFILLLVLLYISNDTILFGTNQNNQYIYFHYLMLSLMATGELLYILLKQIKLSRQRLIVVLSFICLSLISGLINQDFNIKYIYEMFLICFACMYVSIVPFDRFADDFIKVMLFLGICSLGIYLISIFGRSMLQRLPIIRNTAGVRFYNAWISLVPVDENYISIYRNYGVFREPGVFQIFLNLALMLLFFQNSHINFRLWQMCVLVITILSTISTAGYIVMAILLIMYLGTSRQPKEKQLILISIVSAVMVMMIYVDSGQVLFSKIGNKDNVSWISRISAITANLSIAAEHPFWGAGWDNIKAEFAKTVSNQYGVNEYHNTNTFFKILAVHGVPFFFLCVSGMWRFMKAINLGRIISVVLFGTIFLCLSNEDMTFNVVTWIMVLYGWGNWRRLSRKYECESI